MPCLTLGYVLPWDVYSSLNSSGSLATCKAINSSWKVPTENFWEQNKAQLKKTETDLLTYSGWAGFQLCRSLTARSPNSHPVVLGSMHYSDCLPVLPCPATSHPPVESTDLQNWTGSAEEVRAEKQQMQHHWKECQHYLAASSPQQPENTVRRRGLEQRRWKCSSLPLDRRQQNNYAEQKRIFDGSSQTVAKGSVPSLTGMCHCLCTVKGSAMRFTEETISVVAYLHTFAPLLAVN